MAKKYNIENYIKDVHHHKIIYNEEKERVEDNLEELLENNENPEITDRAFLDNLWNFDAVFLCVKLLSVIVSANISIEELLSVQNDFVLRKRIVELDCPPEKIRTMIEETGAKKGSPLEHFYIYHTSKGTARIRQLGNENRLKILVVPPSF